MSCYGSFISEHKISVTFRESFKRLFFRIWALSYKTDSTGENEQSVDYIKLSTITHYSECEPLVTGLGYTLVELNIFKRQGNWQVKAVITGKNGIGVDDCAKVHRALLTRLEAVLDSQDVYVEVASQTDRLIKNAAEFSLFAGKAVKLWNTDITDWMNGTIVSSDDTAVLIDTGAEQVSVSYSKIAKAKLV